MQCELRRDLSKMSALNYRLVVVGIVGIGRRHIFFLMHWMSRPVNQTSFDHLSNYKARDCGGTRFTCLNFVRVFMD